MSESFCDHCGEPLSGVDGALDVIDSTPPSLAMLDINLGDRNSFAVADKLKELKIPYLFATGYGEQVQLPANHKGAALLQKPYTLENVARAFAELTGFSG